MSKNRDRRLKTDASRARADQMFTSLGFGAGSMPNEGMTQAGYVEPSEADLEAELAGLLEEDTSPSPSRSRRAPGRPAAAAAPPPANAAPLDLNALARQIGDFGNVAADNDDDEDIDDADLNDSALLSELMGLTAEEDEPTPPSPPKKPTVAAAAPVVAHKPAAPPPPARPAVAPPPPPPAQRPPAQPAAASQQDPLALIEERLQQYELAIDNANAKGDSSKARRCKRAIQTLRSELRKVKAGKSVDIDSLPPQVATGQRPAAPEAEPAPAASSHYGLDEALAEPVARSATIQVAEAPDQSRLDNSSSLEVQILQLRCDQYKKAALQAKHDGRKEDAVAFMRTMKYCSDLLESVNKGQTVDIDQVPGEPPSSSSVATAAAAAAGPSAPTSSAPASSAPAPATSTVEALTQRMEKLKDRLDKAKIDQNRSKIRRYSNQVKQFEDAIRNVQAGRPVDFDSLPEIPGFGPIPLPAKPTTSPAGPLKPSPVEPTSPSRPVVSVPAAAAAAPRQPAAAGAAPARPPSKSHAGGQGSRNEQQQRLLVERQREYKTAALKAKQVGNLALAKRYLATAKGLDQMIEASQNGLPVDMSQLPSAPGAQKVSRADLRTQIVATPDDLKTGDREFTYKRLEQTFLEQIRMCQANQQKYQHSGDVVSASKYEKLASGCKKDLDALRNAFKRGDPVPRFHYEERTLTRVQCCHELGADDFEVVIVRGLAYKPPEGYEPDDMDTYCKIEFPFPKETPQSAQTETAKDSINPDWPTTARFQMKRDSRVFGRLVKSKSVKVEVYYKRGFFKSDKVLGTVQVAMAPLENRCEIHESLDLMEGRRASGGRLEVKLRIRDPLSGQKQTEQVTEKWLVIDRFDRAPAAAAASGSTAAAMSTGDRFACLEVLQFERDELRRQIEAMRASLSPKYIEQLELTAKRLEASMQQIGASLKAGGRPAAIDYLKKVEASAVEYQNEAALLLRQGQHARVAIILKKKELADYESVALRKRLQFPSTAGSS